MLQMCTHRQQLPSNKVTKYMVNMAFEIKPIEFKWLVLQRTKINWICTWFGTEIGNFIHIRLFNVFTHPCPKVNSDLDKPPLKLQNGCDRSDMDILTHIFADSNFFEDLTIRSVIETAIPLYT